MPISIDFETPSTNISQMHTVNKTFSAVTELAAGSNGTGSTKGLVMDGITNVDWVSPVGITDTWTSNPKNFAGAYICFSPNAAAYDSLLLSFDLKQLFKTANSNTNLRVTVNGAQVGPTYRPPFTGSPIVWQKIKVNLTPFKNLANIQIGLESSVMEEYSNGTGTANLIDNILIERKLISGTKKDILESQLQVYPNPAAGLFNISLPASARNTTLEVTDLSGKVLLKQTQPGTTTQVDLTGKAKGIYLLRITTADGSLVRKLIHE